MATMSKAEPTMSESEADVLRRGHAALERGDFAAAAGLFADLAGRRPRLLLAWCGRAAAEFGAQDLEAALHSAERARTLAPTDARAFYVLGPPAFALGEAAAIARCRRFLATADKKIARELAMFWAQRLSEREYNAEAARAFAAYAEQHSHDESDALQLAQLLLNAFDADAAAAILDRLAAKGAPAAGVEALTARVRLMRGDLAGAAAAAERALAADRECVPAYAVLAETDPAAFDPAREAALRAVLAGDSTTPGQRIVGQAALGRALEKAGRFEDAFDAFATAKRLARQTFDRLGARYDAATAEQAARREVERFAPPPAADPDGAPPRLVFIIGMPRSGSTLIDQILARHSAVASIGESLIMPRLHQAAARRAAASGRPIAECARERRLDFRKAYRAASNGAAVAVDKNLSNYWRCGLIAELDPAARFVLATRDPADVALSIFRTNFMAAHAWANDFDDIAHAIACFEFMAERWRARLPGRIFELRHEELVANFEERVRALLEFCGLPFEPACLEFHEAARPVYTQSAAQVRRPLNAEGVGRWRAYERHLAPFRERLAAHRARLASPA
jgi:tetratricopeptide (TPR) repeat protein